MEKEIYTAQAIFYNADALTICETQKSNTKEVGQMEMHNVTNPLWSQPKKKKTIKLYRTKSCCIRSTVFVSWCCYSNDIQNWLIYVWQPDLSLLDCSDNICNEHVFYGKSCKVDHRCIA